MNDDDTTQPTDPVVDAEIVEPTEEATHSSPSNEEIPTQVSVLLDLENMIKNHISGLETRRENLKKLKEMMSSAFKNDPTYQEAEIAVKDATKLKKEAKARLVKIPEVQNVVEKVSEISTEVKDMDGALSDYLREYLRLSGSTEIQTDDGVVHEIIYIAKLLKKAGKQ